jgi:hypothetical protein
MRLVPRATPLLLLTGCLAAHDPDLGPVVDVPDLDAGSQAMVRPLDASTRLDGAVDASDHCRSPVVQACVAATLGSGVACGTATCRGVTPVCCEHADDIAPSCIGIGVRCEGSSDVSANIADACDDAADCPAGYVCVDSYNKGLNHHDGARCVPRDDAYCGGAPLPNAHRWQRCSADCECPHGQHCQQDAGSCVQFTEP